MSFFGKKPMTDASVKPTQSALEDVSEKLSLILRNQEENKAMMIELLGRLDEMDIKISLIESDGVQTQKLVYTLYSVMETVLLKSAGLVQSAGESSSPQSPYSLPSIKTKKDPGGIN